MVLVVASRAYQRDGGCHLEALHALAAHRPLFVLALDRYSADHGWVQVRRSALNLKH